MCECVRYFVCIPIASLYCTLSFRFRALQIDCAGIITQAKEIIKELGLDRPIVSQYFVWLADFFKGDWGITLTTNQPILDEVKRALPVSLYLMIYGQFIALGLAVPTAVWSAYKQNSRFDRAASTSASRR